MEKTMEKAIHELHEFLDADLYSKFKPDMRIKKEIWTREDAFNNEEEFSQYLREAFSVFKGKIKKCQKEAKEVSQRCTAHFKGKDGLGKCSSECQWERKDCPYQKEALCEEEKKDEA